jgi:hypothetical protein
MQRPDEGQLHPRQFLSVGGEYREDWYNGGRKLTKQNTIGDSITCVP